MRRWNWPAKQPPWAAVTAQRFTCPRRWPTRCAARLDRLSPRVLAVVQAAAVAETPTRALLRAVSGGAADGQVDEALEAGVLEADPPDPVLRFSHPLLREAAEAMLTGPGRRRLHRAIGAALADPDQAAWHLARGADEPDETLAERAEQAAQPRQRARRTSPRRGARPGRGRTHPRPGQPARLAAPYFLAGAAGSGGRVRAGAAAGREMGAACPDRRCAGGSPLCARMWRRQTSRRRAGFYGEAFADLAGRDPARAAQAGARMVPQPRHPPGAAGRGSLPHEDRSSRRHARPGTRSSCGKRWPRRGSRSRGG